MCPGVLHSPWMESPYSTTVSISPVKDSQNRETLLKHTSLWEDHVSVPPTRSLPGMKWERESPPFTVGELLSAP